MNLKPGFFFNSPNSIPNFLAFSLYSSSLHVYSLVSNFILRNFLTYSLKNRYYFAQNAKLRKKLANTVWPHSLKHTYLETFYTAWQLSNHMRNQSKPNEENGWTCMIGDKAPWRGATTTFSASSSQRADSSARRKRKKLYSWSSSIVSNGHLRSLNTLWRRRLRRIARITTNAAILFT